MSIEVIVEFEPISVRPEVPEGVEHEPLDISCENKVGFIALCASCPLVAQFGGCPKEIRASPFFETREPNGLVTLEDDIDEVLNFSHSLLDELAYQLPAAPSQPVTLEEIAVEAPLAARKYEQPPRPQRSYLALLFDESIPLVIAPQRKAPRRPHFTPIATVRRDTVKENQPRPIIQRSQTRIPIKPTLTPFTNVQPISPIAHEPLPMDFKKQTQVTTKYSDGVLEPYVIIPFKNTLNGVDKKIFIAPTPIVSELDEVSVPHVNNESPIPVPIVELLTPNEPDRVAATDKVVLPDKGSDVAIAEVVIDSLSATDNSYPASTSFEPALPNLPKDVFRAVYPVSTPYSPQLDSIQQSLTSYQPPVNYPETLSELTAPSTAHPASRPFIILFGYIALLKLVKVSFGEQRQCN